MTVTTKYNGTKVWADPETRFTDMFDAAKLLNPKLTEPEFMVMYKRFDFDDQDDE